MDEPVQVAARDLTTGRRIRATLLPAGAVPVPGAGADRVPGPAGRLAALGPVPQRPTPAPGLSSRAAATRVLARSVRALGRSPEAATAALLGGFAALFAEAIRRAGRP